MEEVLKSIYYDPSNEGAFSSIEKLYIKAKSEIPTLKRSDVSDWLKTQSTYTLHAPVRRKFKRSRTYVHGIDELYQADLMDMTMLSQWNDGFKWILVVVCTFSKYAWLVPMANKTAKTTTKAIATLLDKISPRKPLSFQTDRGGEFNNEILKHLFNQRSINFYVTSNAETKASIAERLIRTIKSKIYKYLTYANSFRYIDVLDDIVRAYNNSVHRSTAMRPVDVSKANEAEVAKKLYPSTDDVRSKYKFAIGDKVRLSKQQEAFTKGYRTGYTDEIFTIAKVILQVPPRYKVTDALGEQVEGSFYEEEMQKVTITPETLNKIERVIRKRRYRGNKRLFVKWLGLPEKFNSWINEKDVTMLPTGKKKPR